MKRLLHFLEHHKDLFEKDGKLQSLYALYEAIDTFLFTPTRVAQHDVHVRDAIDLKRTMGLVAFALGPCVLAACYFTGHQAHLAAQVSGLIPQGWRHELLLALGLTHTPNSWLSDFVYGLLYFLPIYMVTMTVGGLWEFLFASVRKHEINEGFLVTGLLFPLTLPASIPLWQVAVGISFGVVFGKEIFGGTGRNIFNPALMARAFLFFAYPAQISGDRVWVALDGFSGATALSQVANTGLLNLPFDWWAAFVGNIPGSMGETSTLACLLGALILVATGIGSWRIMLGGLLGMTLMSLLLNAIGSASNPMFNLPPHWHFVLGSFAFAIVFMATDPVSASMTQMGRFIYGFLIGVLGILIRCINPAYPEGWMLAILFMNAFAPVIDYGVMQVHITKRMRR